MKRLTLFFTFMFSTLFLFSCGSDIGKNAEETQEVIKEAYIFAYPMLENYKTMYVQAIDQNSPDFKAPFNQWSHMTRLLDADFTAIVAPNNDTYYSFLWLDLRREPVVISIPPVPGKRYYVLQFIDMFTHNFAYAGARATGYEGGNFLVAGPDWRGDVPKGINKVFRSESQLNYVLGRILVNGPADHDNAMKILKRYTAQPLSAFTGSTTPPPVQPVVFPAYDRKKAHSVDFISYFNFLMNFIELHPADMKYYKKFEPYGIGKGKKFDKAKLSQALLDAMQKGVEEGDRAILAKKKTLGQIVNGWSFVGGAFGSRETMQDRILVRAAAAELGMYGNNKEEASNYSCALDADGKPLDASKGQKYTIRFEKDQTPPVNAFWSVTMYKLPEVLFVHNPINRYSISDRTKGVRFDKDGSLTFYLQHESPGKKLESNWLPAPDGPFMLAMRIYYPQEAVLNGSWKPPAVQKRK